jgi:hypothetical protein
VKNTKEDSDKTCAGQGAQAVIAEPLKIGASTPYDFSGRNLTAYGGLLPVATMLEKLGFQQLLEETLTIRRQTRAMPVYRFVLGMVLVLYVGFSRLNHLRFVEHEPMLTGILKVPRVPPQCTFWRFLASLHLSVAGQLLRVQQILRQRVWQTAHVDLKTITLDTDTTVNTLFGHQMGGRKGYNPKNKGNTSAGNCAMGTGPPALRLRGISKACSRLYRTAWRGYTRAPIPASTVQKRCRPMKRQACSSSSRRGRPRVWSMN